MGYLPIYHSFLHSPIPQLHHQNHQRQAGGDGVGDDDGPGHQQDAIDQPQGHACSEEAVHAQRDAAHVAGAKSLPSLRDEAGGGEKGGDRANPVDEVHGVLWAGGKVNG